MTTSATADYSDTVERERVEFLCKEFARFMLTNEWYKITEEHFDAVKYTRDYQVQMMLKEANND